MSARRCIVSNIFSFATTRSGAFLDENGVVGQVLICGLVVSVSETHLMLIYEVDDGTGLVNCILWKENRGVPVHAASISISLMDHVTILGSVSEFRNQRQLTVSNISVVQCMTEPSHWLESIMWKSQRLASNLDVEQCVEVKEDEEKEEGEEGEEGEDDNDEEDDFAEYFITNEE
eukprot:m.8468 g.8468  ORF g.8468 m.8468 type:complete len:175 (-) comp3137_c0_seq1:283-807(-)